MIFWANKMSTSTCQKEPKKSQNLRIGESGKISRMSYDSRQNHEIEKVLEKEFFDIYIYIYLYILYICVYICVYICIYIIYINIYM